MHIYLVNQSCGPLFIDIVNVFAKEGINTTLITGQINEIQHSVDSHVKIVKLNRYNRSSILKRLISWWLFAFQLFFIALFSTRKSIWLITTNPPFAPWLIGLLRMKKCKVALLVYDIYPEVLTANNIISEEHFLYRFWFALTQNTYKNSNRIISIGDTMAEYIITQNEQLKQKITVIPNWNVIRFPDKVNYENKYKIKRQAVGKIHVVYSGNLGATHDFNTILEAAKLLKNDNRIIFSIIGEGYHTENVKRFISDNQLKNIVLETFKPANEVPEVFLSADVSLVTLGTGVEKSSIPSKTYDALAAGSAILAIAPMGSELERLVISCNLGACFNLGEVEKVVDWLNELAWNHKKLSQFKEAAKEMSIKYSPSNTQQYFQTLTTM